MEATVGSGGGASQWIGYEESMKKAGWLMMIAIIAQSACTSIEEDSDNAAATQFQNGTSTIQDVTQGLSGSGYRRDLDDGSLELSYCYTYNAAGLSQAAANIPIAGEFLSSPDAVVRKHIFVFDAKGVLREQHHADLPTP